MKKARICDNFCTCLFSRRVNVGDVYGEVKGKVYIHTPGRSRTWVYYAGLWGSYAWRDLDPAIKAVLRPLLNSADGYQKRIEVRDSETTQAARREAKAVRERARSLSAMGAPREKKPQVDFLFEASNPWALKGESMGECPQPFDCGQLSAGMFVHRDSMGRDKVPSAVVHDSSMGRPVGDMVQKKFATKKSPERLAYERVNSKEMAKWRNERMYTLRYYPAIGENIEIWESEDLYAILEEYYTLEAEGYFRAGVVSLLGENAGRRIF